MYPGPQANKLMASLTNPPTSNQSTNSLNFNISNKFSIASLRLHHIIWASLVSTISTSSYVLVCFHAKPLSCFPQS